MNIAFVSHSAALTGAERSLITAAKFLRNRGAEILVLLPRHGPLETEMERLGARVRFAMIRRWDQQDPRLSYQLMQDADTLANLLRQEACELVYTNTSVIATGALAAGIANLPHIWHVREFLGNEGFIGKSERARFIAETSNQVLFNSRAVMDDTTSGERWPHAEVVYNYVDLPIGDIDANMLKIKGSAVDETLLDLVTRFAEKPDTLGALIKRAVTNSAFPTGLIQMFLAQNPRPSAREDSSLAPSHEMERQRLADLLKLLPLFLENPEAISAPKLLVLANVVPWKGQDDAIAALAKLQGRDPAPHLFLAGSLSSDPGFGEKLKSLAAQLDVSDRVHLCGAVYDPRPLIQLCDVMIIPSNREPWGRTAVEAMLSKRPVIGAAAGGLTEIIEDQKTGVLYPPRDTDALAAAIQSLLDNRALRAELAENAFRTARKRYSLESYGGAILNAIEVAREQPNPVAGIAAYLQQLDRFSIRSASWTDLANERILRRLRIRRRLRRGWHFLRRSLGT